MVVASPNDNDNNNNIIILLSLSWQTEVTTRRSLGILECAPLPPLHVLISSPSTEFVRSKYVDEPCIWTSHWGDVLNKTWNPMNHIHADFTPVRVIVLSSQPLIYY